jgi:hypothetical protein
MDKKVLTEEVIEILLRSLPEQDETKLWLQEKDFTNFEVCD